MTRVEPRLDQGEQTKVGRQQVTLVEQALESGGGGVHCVTDVVLHSEVEHC